MRNTLVLCVLVCSVLAHAHVRRRQHPKVPDTRMFIPSRSSLLAQNTESDRLGLHRIKNDMELKSMVQSKELVELLSSPSLAIDPRLPQNRRYCRPWTLSFLLQASTTYSQQFGKPLVVTSAVRTEQVQRRLLHWNRNAAPVHGEKASSHLTGATIDISRRSMTTEQRLFTEQLLLLYSAMNNIIVEEERGQLCFHIFVMPQETYESRVRLCEDAKQCGLR
jgi:hypothetical protein